MKKILIYLLTLAVLITLVGCSSNTIANVLDKDLLASIGQTREVVVKNLKLKGDEYFIFPGGEPYKDKLQKEIIYGGKAMNAELLFDPDMQDKLVGASAQTELDPDDSAYEHIKKLVSDIYDMLGKPTYAMSSLEGNYDKQALLSYIDDFRADKGRFERDLSYIKIVYENLDSNYGYISIDLGKQQGKVGIAVHISSFKTIGEILEYGKQKTLFTNE